MRGLVVFDWNGTLLDDTAAVIYADNCALRHFGGNEVDLVKFQETVCIPKSAFFAAHGCAADLLENGPAAVVEFAARHYNERLPSCGLREGALAVLEWLSEREARMLILSNDMVDNIWMQLERLGAAQFIDEVLANTDPLTFMKAAPKQQRLASYLQSHQTEEPRFIIGDSTEEIHIGRNLGLTSIALLNGVHSRQRLSLENPDFMSADLSEALPFIQSKFCSEGR